MKKLIVTALMLVVSASTLMAQSAQKWVEDRSWAPRGFTLKLHESVDADQFRDQYRRNRELWDAVFTYMRDVKLDTLSVGEIPLPGFDRERCFLRVTEGPTRPGATPQPLEHHKKYIDLQYNRTGSEMIAWAPTTEGATVSTPYDPVRDVEYYVSPRPLEYYRSTPDLFFLCFPSDYHMPSLPDGEVASVKKLVIKIEYLQ